MTKSLLLENLPEENLDQVLSLPPNGKAHYFSRLIKNFYPDHKEDTEEYHRLMEAYVSSFYLEKLYRSNRFFNESFTPIVIYESTVYPGATEEVCIPIIEK